MNISLFYFLYGFAFQSSWLDNLIRFLAVDLIYVMLLITIIYIFFHYKFFKIKNIKSILLNNWKEIFSIIISPALALIVSKILKIIVHSDRPFIALANIHTLFTETGYAFPSGHATVISAIAFAIFYKNKRLGYVFMVSALLIGAARVAGGVHFPIDIVGGYIVGFVVAFFVKTI